MKRARELDRSSRLWRKGMMSAGADSGCRAERPEGVVTRRRPPAPDPGNAGAGSPFHRSSACPGGGGRFSCREIRPLGLLRCRRPWSTYCRTGSGTSRPVHRLLIRPCRPAGGCARVRPWRDRFSVEGQVGSVCAAACLAATPCPIAGQAECRAAGPMSRRPGLRAAVGSPCPCRSYVSVSGARPAARPSTNDAGCGVPTGLGAGGGVAAP